MTVERMVRGIAGGLILLGVVLVQYHSIYWIWMLALIGANLLLSWATGFCPMQELLARMGVPRERELGAYGSPEPARKPCETCTP